MERACIKFLNEWLISKDRKPLVIRGARQVGKTWIVRHLAQLNNFKLIEINLEKQPQLASLFTSNNTKQIILNLSSLFEDIDPKKSILFLDEIQAAPELLAKLRWFYEDMPELAVIAAGSLLEFILEKHIFSMPVGRINYMHIEPLSFEEYLLANNKSGLLNYIKEYNLDTLVPEVIHEQLITLFKEYIIIGGMPQAVSNWISNKSLQKIGQIHNDLIATYKDDFAKYSNSINKERLDEVMMAVPLYLGKKFVYSKINPTAQTNSVKQALELLCKARVCHKIISSAANGVPLAAQAQEKFMKIIFLDVGLCSASLGLSLNQINIISEINLINNGGIAEQVIGQILRTIESPYVEPSLYYWNRPEKGSSAEIDYVIQYKNKVIPIEVKAGSTGGLKSLHIFMGLKNLNLAIRINSDLPSKTFVDVKDYQGKAIKYELISIPFYLSGQLHKLLN